MSIKIDRASQSCNVCGKAFADEETYTVGLIETEEDERFQRRDVCNDCWPHQNPAEYRCYWTSEFAKKRRSPLQDADLLWQVFHRSLPRVGEDRETAEFAYVSALALMRLKQMAMVDQEDEGDAVHLVFTRRKNRERYLVPDIKLDEAGIDRVQERLETIAEEGLDDDEEAEESASEENPGSSE